MKGKTSPISFYRQNSTHIYAERLTELVVALTLIVGWLNWLFWFEERNKRGLFDPTICPKIAAADANMKPCSRFKLKEMSGSKILAAGVEDGSTESLTFDNNRTSVHIVKQAVIGISQISFNTEEKVSLEKQTTIPEVAKQLCICLSPACMARNNYYLRLNFSCNLQIREEKRETIGLSSYTRIPHPLWLVRTCAKYCLVSLCLLKSLIEGCPMNLIPLCLDEFMAGMTKTDAVVQTFTDINPDVVLEAAKRINQEEGWGERDCFALGAVYKFDKLEDYFDEEDTYIEDEDLYLDSNDIDSELVYKLAGLLCYDVDVIVISH